MKQDLKVNLVCLDPLDNVERLENVDPLVKQDLLEQVEKEDPPDLQVQKEILM